VIYGLIKGIFKNFLTLKDDKKYKYSTLSQDSYLEPVSFV